MATRLETIRNIRLTKVKKLRELGIDPYPAKSQKDFPNQTVIDQFDKFDGKSVTLTGRLMSWREHGKVVFADLVDQSGKIQLFIKEDGLAPTDPKKQTIGFRDLALFDIGDFIQATGMIVKTKTGQISIETKELRLLAKTIRPLPEKWEGLKDTGERFRKRYLDTLMNAQAKKILDIRWKTEEETRRYLWDLGFIEVETPVLQTLYGGTNAKPFMTHMNALGQDFYLRLAPELYLKRLIVGGYEKVFEIARNFRNEGIDTTHQPEFTMIEWYEAYADYHRVMDVTEGLFKNLVQEITNGTQMTVGTHNIDVAGKWIRITLADALKKHIGVDSEQTSDADLKSLLKKHNLKIAGEWSRGLVLFTLFDHLVTDKFVEPTWVIDYPREVSPLSKEHREKEGLVERFEGYIGGKEIADGWSEINNPLEQRARFENEQKNLKAGDTEAHPLDEDFLEALEYGMPPTGGIGVGIDRLVMFLTNTWSIRETIAFPTLRQAV